MALYCCEVHVQVYNLKTFRFHFLNAGNGIPDIWEFQNITGGMPQDPPTMVSS